MPELSWRLPGFKLDLDGLLGGDFHAPWLAECDFSSHHHSLMTKFKSGQVGFFDWPVQIQETEILRIESLAKKFRRDFQGAILMGIGGSYLGPAAILEALRSPEEQETFPVAWLSNVDKKTLAEATHLASTKKCACVVISKSGNTTETLSAFFYLSHKLSPDGYLLITDPQSGELRRLCAQEGWESLDIPPNIGGRYSVLTAVGMFPTELVNLRARDLLLGARQMRTQLLSSPSHHNPAYHLAALSYLWERKRQHNLHYIMPYSSLLSPFGSWFVQLFAESLGKKSPAGSPEGVGLTPVSALGTSDQHSLLQLLKEGPRDKTVGFIDIDDPTLPRVDPPSFEIHEKASLLGRGFGELNSLALKATEKSLRLSGIPTYRIELSELSPGSLGALFFFFETACAFAGELYGINAFDQPGVEESKKILGELLSV